MSPKLVAPWDPHFDPRLFAHGRLLSRHPGSDGARFSPKLAWRLLAELTAERPGLCLWDPFCGTGLIGSLARVFFYDRLNAVFESDIDPAAVRVAAQNLALVSDLTAAAHRQRQVNGRRGQNAKSEKRWGEVEEYLVELLPRIDQAARHDLPTRTWVGPASDVPDHSVPIAIIADAPYGNQSQLEGADVGALVHRWLAHDAVDRVDLILVAVPASMPSTNAFDVDFQPVRGGRVRLMARRRRATRDRPDPGCDGAPPNSSTPE